MHLSRRQACDLGIATPTDPIPPRRKKGDTRTGDKSGCDKAFDELCKAHGLPIPDHEYLFAPWEGGKEGCIHTGSFKCRCGASRRRWRFDYLFEGLVAVERVGGMWTNGHHSRGKDQIEDMEKRNHAALEGYICLEFTPEQFDTGEAFAFIRRVLEGAE